MDGVGIPRTELRHSRPHRLASKSSMMNRGQTETAMPLTTPRAPRAPLSGTMLDALTREIHARTPRANAAEEITVQPVPMRT
jgi:hypothetical protein